MTKRGNNGYATGIRMATIGLPIFIVLVMANKFIVIEKVPMIVKVVTLLK